MSGCVFRSHLSRNIGIRIPRATIRNRFSKVSHAPLAFVCSQCAARCMMRTEVIEHKNDDGGREERRGGGERGGGGGIKGCEGVSYKEGEEW